MEKMTITQFGTDSYGAQLSLACNVIEKTIVFKLLSVFNGKRSVEEFTDFATAVDAYNAFEAGTKITTTQKKAVLFDSLFACCPYSLPDYRCSHKRNDEDSEETNCCSCYCPLGIEAEQEDVDNPTVSIDWDNMCSDGEVAEGEYLLVDCGSNATEEDKAIIKLVEREEHKWDKEFLEANPYPDYDFEQNTKKNL